MGLFGRSDDKEAKQRELERRISEKLAEVNAEIAEKGKLLADIKRESSRVVADADRRIESANKEEGAVKALRTEVARRIKIAEAKESKLSEMERTFSEHASAMQKEQVRIQQLRKNEQDLKLNIGALEHAFEEKRSVLDQRKDAISRLTKDLNVLLMRRSEIDRIEASLKEAIAKDRSLRAEIVKKEQRVQEGARIISKQQEDVEKYMRLLKDLRSQIEQGTPMRKQMEAEIADRRKVILKAERDLADMEDAVKDAIAAKEGLQKKSAEVSLKERKIAEAESRIDAKKKELERLSMGAEEIHKSQEELRAFVEEKKHILEELKSAIAQNSQSSREAHDNALKSKTAEHDLMVAQRSADKKLKALESKEQSLISRESAFVEHEKALKEASRMLSKDKDELSNEVGARKAEMLLVQQEWEKKIQELRAEKSELQREKQDVRKLVEDDVIGLKDKEDELVETVAMFEEDKKKLMDEEKSVMRRVVELERAKAAYERENKSLTGKEKRIVDGERIVQKGMSFIESEKRKVEQEKDKVYRSRELKKMLPQMERRYEELRRNISKAEARLIGESIKPSKINAFRQRERELSVKEKGIELEVGRLVEQEREVEQLEQRKDRAFSEYLREEVERVTQGRPGREIVHPEIHAMIDDAREKVMQGNVDGAIRLIAEAELLVDKVHNPSQKRLLLYDVRDVKTSIKLATLT